MTIRCFKMFLPHYVQHLTNIFFQMQIESLDNEIAFRDGKRYVNRLTRLKSERQPFASERLLYESETKYLGSVYLTLHPKTERFCMKRGTESSHSSEKEVQIQVTNFWLPSTVPVRLSDAEGCTEYLGFSGIVQSPVQSTNSSCAVQLKTGDSMMGISRQRRLGNLIFVNQKDLLPKPDYLSPQQGATLPSCLALASYALQYVTSDVKGAEVIIHEANRDLGLVGLLVAQAMGFSVICTTSDASLESSKRYLKALGALDVVDAQCSGTYRFLSFTVHVIQYECAMFPLLCKNHKVTKIATNTTVQKKFCP